MSNEQLKHIFDDSVCLTRRQMKDYVTGVMTNEESHAAEVHLNACPFCSEAIDGMFEQKEGNSVGVMAELNADFLKDHFSLHNPQIHLNSLAASAPHHAHHTQIHSKRKKMQPQPALFRNISIAAAVLLCVAVLWFVEFDNKPAQQHQIADATPVAEQSAPVVQDAPQEDAPVSKAVTPANTQGALAKGQIAMAEKPQPSAPMQNGSNPQVPQPLIATDTKAAAKRERAEATDIAEDRKEVEEEVVVTAYKAPIISRYAPGSANSRASEEIEKMPSRTTEGVAATAGGVYSGSADGLKIKQSKDAAIDNKAATAEDLYKQKNYKAALNAYKKDMSSDSQLKRQQATVMAARCYMGLGNKARATQLLQSIVDEGGPQKRAAKKLLRQLEAE